jgi:bacterioferritin
MGNEKLIQYLNDVLGYELTLINQYFLHAKIYDEMGMGEQGDYEFNESVDETRYANRIIDRVIALGGMPNLQDLKPMHIGQTSAEIIEADLTLEMGVEPLVREAIHYCTEIGDYESEFLLQELLDREEGQVNWLEVQKRQLSDAIPASMELSFA